MKRTFALICAVSAGLFTSALRADQVDYLTGSGTYFTLAGTAVPVGNAVWLGFFPTGFTFTQGQTFAQLNANFTRIDTVQFGQDESGLAGGGAIAAVPAGLFYGSAFGNQIGVGQQLYFWAFNVADPTATAPTQFAIVTNTTWIRLPAGTPPQTIDPTSDLGTFIPPNTPGTRTPTSATTADIRLGQAPVPEPSTYALALVGLGIAAGIARRRRQAVG